MRIVHVATLVSPDGAYGGPIRVALNQLRELAKRGHDVELVAGASGFGQHLPTEIDDVPVSLFRAFRLVPSSGFASLIAPGLNAHLRRQLKCADAVHIHLARDLVTMPAAWVVRRSRVPLFVQPHGMIAQRDDLFARLFDRTWTRPNLQGAQKVLALTTTEAADLQAIAPRSFGPSMILNGVPTADFSTFPVGVPDVLFLARLHSRKRPLHFVEMAGRLLDEGIDATFSLVGPDEGEGQSVKAAIARHGIADRVRWEGALAPGDTLRRISESTIYVLPSVSEILPMSVLEALSLGKPVVVTSDNGLAEPLRENNAGLVVEFSVDDLVAATRSLLLDKSMRENIGANGLALAKSKYTMSAIASQLEMSYAAR